MALCVISFDVPSFHQSYPWSRVLTVTGSVQADDCVIMVFAHHSESSCQSPAFISALGSLNKTGSGAEKEVVWWKVGPASRSAGSLAHMNWSWEAELMWYMWIVDPGSWGCSDPCVRLSTKDQPG